MPLSTQNSSRHAELSAAVQRGIVYVLSVLLIWQPMLLAAQPVTPTHSTSGRPTLDAAPNGVPVVNIAAPQQGLSHNFYQDFTVSEQGLILNNSRALTQTELGGFIEANPNLSSGSARVILNEVIGSNPSALNGYIEVGGQQAEMVVANPNGITCNGCGFINAQHGTLTTGVPIISEQQLSGYDVRGGHIAIGENGLNGANTSRFDVIARSVSLAGELHADELNIVTGQQTVARDTLATDNISTDSGAPTFAIDSTALGGMYANRIRLIATEDGVGVRLNAPVAAQNGDFTLSANGRIELQGASATGEMSLVSSEAIALQGRTVAGEAMSVFADEVDVVGEQVSARAVSLDAQTVSVSENAALYGQESLAIQGENFNNEGQVASQQLSVSLTGSIDNSGALFSEQTLSLSADQIINHGDIQAQTTGEFHAETVLDNRGQLIAGSTLTVVADNTSLTNSGIISANEDVSLSVSSLDNYSGAAIRATGNLDVHAQSHVVNEGSMISQQHLQVDAQSIVNRTGAAPVDGDGVLGAAEHVAISGDILTNQGGALLGSGGTMELLLDDAVVNELASIQAVDSIYIGAAYPEQNDDVDAQQAIDDAKNTLVRNDQGEIVSLNGDITILTEELDNSREISLSRAYGISAADLMEANILALQDDDEFNDLVQLLNENFELSNEDWAFIFDPDVFKLRIYITGGADRRAFVDHYMTHYVNYLNDSLSANLSAADIDHIRGVLVGTKTWQDHRTLPGYVYSGDSESVPIKINGEYNPLADSLWIISRVTQIIKALNPDKYQALLAQVEGKLESETGTLNVWQKTCGRTGGDWRSGNESCDNNSVHFYQFGEERFDDVLDQETLGLASLLSAGGALNLYADKIDNRYSTLAAGGDLRLEGGTLINESYRLQRHYDVRWGSQHWHNYTHEPGRNWRPQNRHYEGRDEITVDLLDENGNPAVVNSIIAVGGNITGSLSDTIENAEITTQGSAFEFDVDEYVYEDTDPDAGGDEGESNGEPNEPADPESYVAWEGSDTTRVIDTINARTLALFNMHNSLFLINDDPGHPYLIETNPLFSSQSDFLGSSYLIDRLGLSPNVSSRRLGDSYYETQLIRDAVLAATGTRFLDPDYQSDQEQFTMLMNNAIAAAESLELSVGISLAADQINALQNDIIWMEESIVAGHRVLVPVLYLAAGSVELTQEGSVISGQSIHLNAEGIANSGAISARQDMVLAAGDKGVINEDGLLQAGGAVMVDSKGDIKNHSSLIQGRDVYLSSLGEISHSVDMEQIEEEWEHGTHYRTTYGEASQIEATGSVVLDAAEHLTITGSHISAEQIALAAGGVVQVQSAEVSRGFDGRYQGGKYQFDQTRQLASQLTATMDVMITAGNSAVIAGSHINAGNNIDIRAIMGDVIVSAAANSDYENYHAKTDEEETTRIVHQIDQQQSRLSAGGDIRIDAAENLSIIASELRSSGDLSLKAGGQINLLAAQNRDYRFYENEKDGDYGAKSYKKDEIDDIQNVVTTLASGGAINIDSGGDQTYEAARIESAGDIHISSEGSITFASVKDLYKEIHERSQGDLAWNKMSGEGTIDETLLQTQMHAMGNIAINAAEGMTIDLKDMDDASIGELIDSMVANEPDLAWLKQAHEQGDVEWERVKEVHEQWDYESESLGVGASLVVAIVMTAATWGAGAGIVNAVAGPGAAAAGTGAVAAAATGAVVTSATTTVATATINNGGRLDAALSSIDNSEFYKGLGVSAITAGLMVGVDDFFSEWDFLDSARLDQNITTDTVLGITKGFDLGSIRGGLAFAFHSGTQAALNAGVSSTINGNSFNDAFKVNLESQGNNVLSALAFYQIGDWADAEVKSAADQADINKFKLFVEGGFGRAAMHTVTGGLVTEITSGDFSSGAAAAGTNQLLSGVLHDFASSVGGEDNYGAWRTAGSQLAGLAGAALANGDVNDGAWIAKQADTYNRQLHRKEFALIREKYKEYAEEQREIYGRELTDREALSELLLAAMSMVDAEYDNSITQNPFAEMYLAEQAQREGFFGNTLISSDGKVTKLFHASDRDYRDSFAYMFELKENEEALYYGGEDERYLVRQVLTDPRNAFSVREGAFSSYETVLSTARAESGPGAGEAALIGLSIPTLMAASPYALLAGVISWEGAVIHDELAYGRGFLEAASDGENLQFGAGVAGATLSYRSLGLKGAAAAFSLGATEDVAYQGLVEGKSFEEIDYFGSVNSGLLTTSLAAPGKQLFMSSNALRLGALPVLTGYGAYESTTHIVNGYQTGNWGEAAYGGMGLFFLSGGLSVAKYKEGSSLWGAGANASGMYAMQGQRTAPSTFAEEFVGPLIGGSGYKSTAELANDAFLRYQRYSDDAYDAALRAEAEGRLVIPEGVARETIIGQKVDRAAQARLRNWIRSEGLREGAGEITSVNRWLRDPSGSGSYRIPDFRIDGANSIFDGTIGYKWSNTPQVQDFFRFSNGSNVTIVRPQQLGGSYSIFKP